MHFIYCFVDVLTGVLLKAIDKWPVSLKLFLIVFILAPGIILAGLADYLGKKAEDVT